MARKLRISSQLYGRYEQGKQKPGASFFVTWKKIFGEDLTEGIEPIVSRATLEQQPATGPMEQLLGTLMKQQNRLMEIQNMILKDHTEQVKDKIAEVDLNLKQVVGKAESLQYDLISGREIVLQSLARLEGKGEDELLSAADKRKKDLVSVKNERYRTSGSGK